MCHPLSVTLHIPRNHVTNGKPRLVLKHYAACVFVYPPKYIYLTKWSTSLLHVSFVLFIYKFLTISSS